MNGTIEFHEYANIFPMMSAAEFDALKSDMLEHGYRKDSPVVLFEGKILDGRNRYNAAQELGIKAEYIKFNHGGNPLDFVVSSNLHRRHLSESQRAAISAELANIEKHKHITDTQICISQPQAAKLLNVSPRMVASAKKVQRKSKKLFEQVKAGKITVNKAVRTINRKEKIDAIVANNKPLDDALGKFNVLYADPPWRYEHVETENRAIENQYPTMALEEICAMPIGKIAEDDCVLFMWATSPKLAEAMRVLEAWGFNYRTCAVWVKDKIGMGYYFRQRHELLLVATRGNLPTPGAENRPDSVMEFPRTEHSKKPHEVYKLIERMYPEFVKCELFARNTRKGWKSWGNQAN